MMRKIRYIMAVYLVGMINPAAHAGSFTIQIDRLGHVYAPDETILVTASGADHTVTWALTDMFGKQVASGTAKVRDGGATITPTPGSNGWFRLVARDDAGQTAQTTLAVVPMPSAASPSERFAVMTHFAQAWDTDILPLVARAGIGQVRDELYWNQVEKLPGQYSLPERYLHYLNALSEQHVKLLLVLSFANPLYDGGDTPYTPAGRAAYAAYGAYLAKTLGNRLSGVEVWNEFNGSFCKGACDKDRPAAYAELLAAAYPALKRVAPTLPVGGGAAVLVPKPWFDALFEHGALDNLDAIVIHPYRPVAEGVELSLDDLGQLTKARQQGPAKPIWATEFSHFDKSPDGGAETARYLVREATIMLEEGVTRLSWYLLRDYAAFETMGLVSGPDTPLGRYAPAPAYPAFATLIRELDRAIPQGREVTDVRTRLYRFNSGANALRVGWSSEGTAHLVLNAPGPIERIDMMGNSTRLEPANGRIEVTLDHNPVYFRGNIEAVQENGRDSVLAQSAQGFTGTPTASSDWSYGAYVCGVTGGGTDACAAGYADAKLVPLEWKANAWDWAWRSSRFHSLEIGIEAAHPSAIDGSQVWAVRRWTAHHAGVVLLSGYARRPAGKGDGTDALILVDGKPTWHQALGNGRVPEEQKFAVKTRVSAGSSIDFAVTPGPRTDIENDATAFAVYITDVSGDGAAL
jgi:hypothetical protein